MKKLIYIFALTATFTSCKETTEVNTAAAQPATTEVSETPKKEKTQEPQKKKAPSDMLTYVEAKKLLMRRSRSEVIEILGMPSKSGMFPLIEGGAKYKRGYLLYKEKVQVGEGEIKSLVLFLTYYKPNNVRVAQMECGNEPYKAMWGIKQYVPF